MMTEKNILSYIKLSLVSGFGPVSENRLLDACGGIEACFEMPEEELLEMVCQNHKKTSCDNDETAKNDGRKMYFLNENRIHRFVEVRHSPDLEIAAETILKRCRENGIRVLVREDEVFPKRFQNLPDVPAMLFIKGDCRINDFPETVGIVGARRCTREGRLKAIEIASESVAAGKAVISGMAKGIDSYGHTAAIKNNGYTVAVLGSSPDICYPPEHRALYDAIAEHGCIVSEYPPVTWPKAYHFPKRNRIIAALSDEVVVIDAGRNSGTESTMKFCEKYGREVRCLSG